MKISIFGLGYVGTVTAACLAERGFHVVGVDVNQAKVDLVNAGRPPVLERQLDEYVKRNVEQGRLSATTDVQSAISRTDVSLVCVGTPSKINGDLDLQYVTRVAEQIGRAIKAKSARHLVIIRSTMLPGTTWDVMRPVLEKTSEKRAGVDFGLCFNPEFLREGSAIADFHEPPFTVIGIEGEADADELRPLYDWLDAEVIVVPTRVAETIKYVNNSYHALKVAFANEVGRFCRALVVDSHQVMDIFCKDTKQNLSAYYLKPGFAFGGSCLPKDLRAILYQAKSLDVPMEVFSAVLPSNQTQIDLGVRMVEQAGSRKVGLLGLSFKAGTDDLRESPLVTLAETLHGRGFQVKIYDEHVSLSRLIGANKAYVEHQLPHIGAMLCETTEEVIEASDTVVIGNKNSRFKSLVDNLASSKSVVDLVRLSEQSLLKTENYRGIGW